MVLRDPCDHWMVYDLVSDRPAETAGRVLLGLSRKEAEQTISELVGPTTLKMARPHQSA
ncbi:hypothetical protein MesoLj113b_69860 (plasmid) [Mesorhizobium sp. 113-3-3]|nr:hypothetical protein MesoLj113b_69860 [Mesorhizobium sp. 113-3-3]